MAHRNKKLADRHRFGKSTVALRGPVRGKESMNWYWRNRTRPVLSMIGSRWSNKPQRYTEG